MAPTPDASIVVVTRNRKEELRVALVSATEQAGNVEVIVIDDGSSDGTPDMVARDFPSVRLLRSTGSDGYIRQRNRGAHAAQAPVVVSLDDDAEFSAPDIVMATLPAFDHPRIAAVAMPFVQERRGSEILQRAPTDDGRWLTNVYIGTAHAVRRDIFLALGAYNENLEHLLEEGDYCLRLLRAGYVVRLGRGAPIVHHESTTRNTVRDSVHIPRNHALLTWWHVPLPYALWRAGQVIGYVAWASLRWGAPGPAVKGLISALTYALRHRGERAPLRRSAYRLHRRLRRRPERLEAVEHQLPAPANLGRLPG